jgi:hypothetical protein
VEGSAEENNSTTAANARIHVQIRRILNMIWLPGFNDLRLQARTWISIDCSLETAEGDVCQ